MNGADTVWANSPDTPVQQLLLSLHSVDKTHSLTENPSIWGGGTQSGPWKQNNNWYSTNTPNSATYDTDKTWQQVTSGISVQNLHTVQTLV